MPPITLGIHGPWRGGAAPSPLECELDPLREPLPKVAKTAAEPSISPASEFRATGYTVQAQLRQGIGVDHMRACAEYMYVNATYGPWRNA